MIHREPYNPAEPPLAHLTMSPELHAAIITHLERHLPNEACGLLAVESGDSGAAVHFFPGSNTDASPTRFTMDGKEVIDALRDMERRGWRLGAIVHSHPKHPAEPSRTDLIEALYPAALMVICSFLEPDGEVRAWALEGRCGEPALVRGERPVTVIP